MNTKHYFLALPLAVALAVALASGSIWGAAFVRNPSFESNFNETWPYYGSVDEWSGASGVNDVEFDPNGPFHNAGTPVPDRARVGFKQGGGDVTQEIYELEPGGTYWLQFFYDGRRGGGASEEVIVYFDDVEIGRDPNIRPSNGAYYFMNAPFTPQADYGTIRFTHVVSGDRTILLDGVTVVARSTDDVVLRNPSFEASGILPFTGALPNIAGWSQTGTVGVDDGSQGIANSGTIPDQDLVGFIEGEGSLSQTLDGLIVGNEYELRVAANARAGTAPRLQVKVGETVVLEEDIASGEYQALSATFTASASEAILAFHQTKAGSDTVLLDNVRLFGEVQTPLPPMTFSPLVSEVSSGAVVTHTLTIPAEAVATGGVSIQLGSSSTAVGRLVGAAADGTLTLSFEQNVTSKTFEVETLGRGSVAINVLDAAKIPFPATPVVNVVGSLVKNASFESGPAPAFPGYGAIIGWQGEGNVGVNRTDGPANPANPFGDNGLVPDREQVAFIQGNGSLSQQINGLTAGRNYWLQYYYNARTCCGERSQKLIVRFDGQVVAEYPDLIPAGDLGEVNYYHASVAFTPANSSGLLEFVHEATGDASAVIDAVSIVARVTDEIVLQNPSFEASGSPPGVGYLQPFQIAGWEGIAGGGRGVNVDGVGPFSDNGAVPDQDRTGFIQGVGGYLSQVVTGLTFGQPYTLVISLNGRNCCGGVPFARVSWNDVPLLEEEVPPVGGRTPFAAKYLTFTADSAEGLLRIEIADPVGSDVSLLVDDVHVVPGERTPPSIAVHPFGQFVGEGSPILLTVEASGSNLTYQWRRNGVWLTDGGRISGATSPTLSIPNSTVADTGDYTALVSDGLGVFSSEPATVEVEGGATSPALRAVFSESTVQIRWPADAVGYQLHRTALLGGEWVDVTDPVIVDETTNENVVEISTEDSTGFFQLSN